MLLTREQTIDEEIVRTLSKRPGLQLQEIIAETGPKLKKPVSIQAWYQAMKRLREKYIVVKVGKTYSINVSWMHTIERWGSVLEEREVKTQYQDTLNLPVREGVVQKYRFGNLLEMNAFWAHILVYIANAGKESTTPPTPPLAKGRTQRDNDLYGYLPRFWFYLAQEVEEQQYMANLKAAGTRSYQLVGARSFLDGWNLKQVDKSVAQNYMSPTPLGKYRERYVNVIQDYTLEARLHKTKAETLDKVFSETSALDEGKRAEIVKFMSEKSPCQMLVYRDTKEREKFVRKVKRYF